MSSEDPKDQLVGHLPALRSFALSLTRNRSNGRCRRRHRAHNVISDGLHQRDKWYNSLRLRMMIMMSLALLPIGMIAVTQTKSVSNAARESAQLSLSLMTEQAAFQERLGIERAMAISQLMALRAPDLLQDTDACFDELSNIITANPRFSNATITPTNGMTTCSSVRGSFDFADLPSFQNLINTDGPAIAVDAQAPLSGTSVVIVSMPRNLSEREFLEGSSNTFYATSVDGRELLYALVPIRGSALSVLGIWSPDAKLNLQAAGRPMCICSLIKRCHCRCWPQRRRQMR